MRRALYATWCLILAAVPVTAALSESAIHDLYSEGKALFREATEMADQQPGQAHDLFRGAALRFERIVTEGNIENGRLYYNIGNCYFLMEDMGRAILNYRRAAQFIPNDPNLIQNLSMARSRRLDRIEVAEGEKVLKTLFFFHYDLSQRTRSALFMGCFVLAWVLLSLRLFIRRPVFSWAAGITGTVALAMLVSLSVQYVQYRTETPGVVLSGETVARKGDGRTYEPAFTEPLHAGTEFTVVEDRGDWLHVRLADGRGCWLSRNDVGLVR